MLAFLHVFHHSTTALLTFVEIEGKVSGVTDDLIQYLTFLLTFHIQAWSIICPNLAVHVMMCMLHICSIMSKSSCILFADYYYFRTAGGAKLWVCSSPRWFCFDARTLDLTRDP